MHSSFEYLHGSGIMLAMKKKKSSHTWRAILYGREALCHGLIKIVGVVA